MVNAERGSQNEGAESRRSVVSQKEPSVRSLLVSALLAVASAASVLAQTSTTRLILYAGVAVDDGGRPLSGQVAATFELYEEHEGGAPLWRETQQVTADERGRYLVYLGSATPMPQIAFSKSAPGGSPSVLRAACCHE